MSLIFPKKARDGNRFNVSSTFQAPDPGIFALDYYFSRPERSIGHACHSMESRCVWQLCGQTSVNRL